MWLHHPKSARTTSVSTWSTRATTTRVLHRHIHARLVSAHTAARTVVDCSGSSARANKYRLMDAADEEQIKRYMKEKLARKKQRRAKRETCRPRPPLPHTRLSRPAPLPREPPHSPCAMVRGGGVP